MATDLERWSMSCSYLRSRGGRVLWAEGIVFARSIEAKLRVGSEWRGGQGAVQAGPQGKQCGLYPKTNGECYPRVWSTMWFKFVEDWCPFLPLVGNRDWMGWLENWTKDMKQQFNNGQHAVQDCANREWDRPGEPCRHPGFLPDGAERGVSGKHNSLDKLRRHKWGVEEAEKVRMCGPELYR